MAKRERWLLRVALEIDGGLTTANKALEALREVREAVEAAGYLVLGHRGAAAPMNAEQRSKAHSHPGSDA
jgi:hypothetical protein